MEVVPVIDLKGGVVVRARHGDRASYRPIETPLSPTSDPLDVVAGLLSVHPFRTLYVADLDAIEGRGDASAILERIAKTFPHLSLWVDNGCAELGAARGLSCAASRRLARARIGIAARRNARRRAPRRSARHPLARFSRRRLSRAAGAAGRRRTSGPRA